MHVDRHAMRPDRKRNHERVVRQIEQRPIRCSVTRFRGAQESRRLRERYGEFADSPTETRPECLEVGFLPRPRLPERMNPVICNRKLLVLRGRQITLRERIDTVDPAAHFDVDSQIALTRDRDNSVPRRMRHAESKIERVVGKVRPPMAAVAKSNRCRVP